MFCSDFLILMCLFIISGTASSPKKKGFYISGLNTSCSINIIKDTIKYKYEKDEVLNISCHNELKQPVTWLIWQHNEQNIPGVEKRSIESKLSFNITKNNDKDRLACYAIEDDTGLMKDEKKTENMIIVILDYVGREDTTTSEPQVGVQREDTEDWFEKLSNSKLFWSVLAVIIIFVILVAVVIVASKKSNRAKDKVTLHSAVSNASVFSTESKTPIIPQAKTMEANFYSNYTYNTDACMGVREILNSEYQEPIDSQAYSDPQTYCEPEKQIYAEPIPRILRMKKDNVYVNYNKSNGSANINNENITDLYQNFEDIRHDELNYYTETC